MCFVVASWCDRQGGKADEELTSGLACVTPSSVPCDESGFCPELGQHVCKTKVLAQISSSLLPALEYDLVFVSGLPSSILGKGRKFHCLGLWPFP